jgi:hypothetical protein
VYISHDVVFDETVFPFAHLPQNSTIPSTVTTPPTPDQFVDASYTPSLLPNKWIYEASNRLKTISNYFGGMKNTSQTYAQ